MPRRRRARRPGPALPHLISVSTAYVAGMRRGPAPEALLSDTPFSARVALASRGGGGPAARRDAEAASRDPKQLGRLRAAARAELGAAGVPLLAEKMEKLRAEWTDDRMVELGKARAQALGWPDAYAYSKALGEWALLEGRGALPVTVVRPSIIEAALSQPHPGWIRGFRMADPVIISYARGLLKEFPGIPEGIIDVIPVDLVVAAILAVAARGPLEHPDVVHAASGARNPLRYGQLVDLVREWFSEHPLADDKGQPIEVPEWSFPGRRRVQNQLRQATKALRGAERALQALPLRGSKAELASRIEERRDEAERALGYVELYGAYTETEAVFAVDHLLALKSQLSGDEEDEFCFDPPWSSGPASATTSTCRPWWPTPVCARPGPAAGAALRSRAGQERARQAVLSPDRQLAVFDLENTLVATNVVDSYAWFATRRMDNPERARFTVRTLLEAPRMLSLDMVDRGDFLRWFYRRYEHADLATLRQDSWELTSDLLLAKSFPAGIRRVREHRALGHRTLLITGALDFVIEPFRPLFDDVVCAHMGHSGGKLSGEMVEAPPTGEARALIMADYAREHGLDLGRMRGLRRLHQRPPHARGGRLPRRRQPRDQAGRPGPQAGLARRTMAPGRRLPARPIAPRSPFEPKPGRRRSKGHMKALQVERSLPRFAVARIASEWRAGAGGRFGPLRLVDIDPPVPARPRVAAPAAPPDRDLRERPGHGGRALFTVVRAHRQLPLRARSRGCGRHRGRPPSRHRTGARLPSPGHRAHVRGLRAKAGAATAST